MTRIYAKRIAGPRHATRAQRAFSPNKHKDNFQMYKAVMQAFSHRYDLWSALFGPFLAGAMIMAVCALTLLVAVPMHVVGRLASLLHEQLTEYFHRI